MPLYAGDPLTPGVGATAGAKRLQRSEARTLPTIPVQPLSWPTPVRCLRRSAAGRLPADGPAGFPSPITSAGARRVHLKLRFDWRLVPAYDVIARIPGAELPDQWVVRGNHHDAWVNGAEDPVSGVVAVLEEVRAYGTLLKQGWRPGAPSSLPRGTGRSRCCSARPSGSRPTRTS